MNGTNVTVASSKGISTLVRAKFAPGMLLHHEDLEQLGSSSRELSRLLFRSLFGCGVVCGLVVKTEQKCDKLYVTVGAGLALTCAGDPLYVPKDHSFAIDDTNLPDTLWVVLCGTTKCCAPRTSTCASDKDEAPSACTRERDGFEIRAVSARTQCLCGCPEPEEESGLLREDGIPESPCKCVDPDQNPCYRDHYDGKCGCAGDDCCDCACVLLARFRKPTSEDSPWKVDHSVRRFVRPVLIRDPQVEIERSVLSPAGQKPGDAALALRAAKRPVARSAKIVRPRRP